MDSEQQQALQEVQAEISATQPAESTQDDTQVVETSHESQTETSAEQKTTESDNPPQIPTPGDQKEEEAPSGLSAYQEKLNSLMAKQREQYDGNVKQKQEREHMDRLRRIEEAKQYGPDAVLRAAGLDPGEAQHRKGPATLDELLGLEPEDSEPAYVKQLKQRVEEQGKILDQFQASQQQQQQQYQQQQQAQWEQQELGRISQFIDSSKDKYQYLAALRPMKSDHDLYSGMLNMYNQGYQPDVEDMAELVETRVQAMVDHLVDVPKFREWISKRLGVQLAPKKTGSQTLSNRMGGDSPGEVDISQLPEDEQMKIALEAAYAAAGKNGA